MGVQGSLAPSYGQATLKSIRRRGFATPLDSLISIMVFGALLYILWLAVDWAILRAVWGAGDVGMCGGDAGACWSVISARYRLIFFGLYPYDQHWRSTLACVFIVATVVLSCVPSLWSAKCLALLWAAGFAGYYLVMEGSLLGLPQVTTDQWGGLALTLFLFASVVILGMPMGLGLALMRRSDMPVVRIFAGLTIDSCALCRC